MKSHTIAVLLLAFTFLFGSTHAQAPAPPVNDKDKLQGAWSMVFAVGGGRVTPQEEIANLQLFFRGDKYTLFRGEDRLHDHGAFKLDPTQSPRAIDITEDQGPNKGTSNRGIYLLDGDTLMICYNSPDMKRPTEFTSRADTSLHLFIYKRTKP